VLAAVYCLEARRFRLYWFFFFMALVCREDVSIGLCVLGLFSLLSGYRPRTGLLTAAIAGTYFGVMKFAIMPLFGSWWFSEIYKDLYPADDTSFRGVMRTLISNPGYVWKTLLTPEKLRYTLQVLAPLLFLPVRRVFLVPCILAGALSTLLTTGYGPTLDTGFQYIGNFIGYIFPAAAVALGLLARDPEHGQARLRAAGLALAVATFVASVSWGAFSPRHFVHGGFGNTVKGPPSHEHIKKEQDLRALAAQVPPDARLGATEAELPHLSTRLFIFALRDGLFDADYLLYDVNGYGAKNAEEALARGEYAMVEERGQMKLLRKVKAP
jgi:hypothetical protein